jgi:predicted dehydrogenase
MLNFGIIGTGWITASFVTSAHATKKWQLRAVYSRNSSTASDFASKFSFEVTEPIKAHAELSALVSDHDVQAVYIASPNSLHYAHAKQMLEGGKHVILEKPATSTSAELDSLFALAKSKNVFLIEAFRHVHEVNFKILKKELSRLGPIYGASLNYAAYSSRYDNVLKGEVPNIFNLDFSGGSLVDLGVYPISAAVDLFGAPKSSAYYPVMIATGADGGGTIVLRYEGFTVSILASKIYTSTAPSEVFGEKGTLSVPTITDIESVKFLDAKLKGKATELGSKKCDLNLQEEADLFAGIIEGGNWAAAKELEGLSRAVIEVTESCRKANGLVFKVEKGQ